MSAKNMVLFTCKNDVFELFLVPGMQTPSTQPWCYLQAHVASRFVSAVRVSLSSQSQSEVVGVGVTLSSRSQSENGDIN